MVEKEVRVESLFRECHEDKVLRLGMEDFEVQSLKASVLVGFDREPIGHRVKVFFWRMSRGQSHSTSSSKY